MRLEKENGKNRRFFTSDKRFWIVLIIIFAFGPWKMKWLIDDSREWPEYIKWVWRCGNFSFENNKILISCDLSELISYPLVFALPNWIHYWNFLSFYCRGHCQMPNVYESRFQLKRRFTCKNSNPFLNSESYSFPFASCDAFELNQMRKKRNNLERTNNS